MSTRTQPGAGEPGDEDLMARIVRRDGAAFAMLVARHVPRLLALAQSVLGSRTDADDIVQEAFLRVWAQAARFDPARAALTTWLHRIVVNLCLDRLRKPRPAPLDDDALAVVDPSDSAFDRFAAQERADLLRAALGRMPARQRLALALFYFQDLDLRAGAAAMELSPGAFEALLRRARRTLKTILSLPPDDEMTP
jgi:RNA polymerase sigma-70 factor, ECF subfamily